MIVEPGTSMLPQAKPVASRVTMPEPKYGSTASHPDYLSLLRSRLMILTLFQEYQNLLSSVIRLHKPSENTFTILPFGRSHIMFVISSTVLSLDIVGHEAEDSTDRCDNLNVWRWKYIGQ